MTLIPPSFGGESLGQKLRRHMSAARWTNPLVLPPLQTVPAWASGTVYTVGNIVSNGGLDYVCYAGGTSAGSGGPTGQGPAGIIDNTVTWFFNGLTATTTNSPFAPALTSAASPAGNLTRSYVVQTNDANFFYSGGVPSVVFGTAYRFPAATATPSPGNATATGNNYYFGVSLMTDAPVIAFKVGSGSRPYYYIVDGQYVSISGLNPSAGGVLYHTLNFSAVGGRKARHITLESDSASDFLGVFVDYASTVWTPNAADNIRAIFVGDSYTDGGNAFPIAGNAGWPIQVAKRLGWNDPWNSGLGGTGYIANDGNNNVPFIGRITDVTAHSPDVIIIMGGANDAQGNNSAQIQAAALIYLQGIRSALPNTPIIVSGIWASNSSATIVAAENAVFAAVAQFADALTFTIPISTDVSGQWSTGTGQVSGQTGVGNNDVYIGNDGAHPIQNGIDFLAYRMTNALRNVIQLIP